MRRSETRDSSSRRHILSAFSLSFPQPTSTLKSQVGGLVGGCGLAAGAFTFEAIQREFRPRGEVEVGKGIGYL